MKTLNKMTMELMKTKRIILLALTILALTSCAPDPRKQAEADATRMQAESQAANEQQAREQDQQQFDYDMQNKRAAQKDFQAAVQHAIQFGGYVVMILMFGVGVAALWGMYSTTRAYHTFIQQRMEVLANQIPLDPKTHTYPLLTVRVGPNIVALVNPNTEATLLLDERRESDRAMIQAFANVTFAGELANKARLSLHPAEISSIPAAQIIEGE